MSVTITFYNFTKRENETLQPSGGTEIQCALKEPTDYESPSFIITGNHFSYTYAKWDNHYYFVTGVRSLGANRCEVSCDLDRLATYKTQIGNTQAYVVRASSDYNSVIIDAKYPTNTNVTFHQVPITNPLADSAGTDYQYVLSVMGSDGLTERYAMTLFDIDDLCEDLYSSPDFLGIFQSSVNPMQYISSVMCFPYGIGNLSAQQTFHLGSWSSTNTIGALVLDPIEVLTAECTIYTHPQAGIYPWVKHAPFSKYTLYFEPFGVIELDANAIMNSTEPTKLYFSIRVDRYSGEACLDVRINNIAGITIAHARAQVGIPVQITGSQGMTIGSAASSTLGVLGGMGAIAAGNPVGGLMTAMSTVASAVESTIPKPITIGSNGSYLSAYYQPIVVCEFIDIVDQSITTMGRPLCEHRTINTLSGFIQCENASVAISGTERSRSIINNYLNTGFYYT